MREPNAVDRYIRLDPKTGLFVPVWMYRAIINYWLGPDPMFSNSDPIVINASGTRTPPVTYKLPHSSQSLDDHLGNPLLITRLVFEDATDGTTNAAWTVLMEDVGDQLRYMNYPVHIRTFAGGVTTGIGGATNSMLPALLSEPLFLPTRHNLMMTLDKISGGAVNTHLFPVGGLFDIWSTILLGPDKANDKAALIALTNKLLERRKYIYPYWFTTDTGPMVIPAAQTMQQDVTVGDDGHFEATNILAVSSQDFEVEFFNPDTRQTLMNGRIHSSMIGNSFNPQPFPCSMIFTAGTTIRFIVRNLANTENTIYITLRGRRIRAPLGNRKQIEDGMKQIKMDYSIPSIPGLLPNGVSL